MGRRNQVAESGSGAVRCGVALAIALTSLIITVLALSTRAVRQYAEIGQWRAATASDGVR